MFKYPPIYNFPPFFTKQINDQTWNSQLEYWTSLILDYCKFYRLWIIHSDDELFKNSSINRQLNIQCVQLIFDYMVKQGQAEYNQEENTTSTTSGTSIVVYWKSVNDWISLFGDWLDSTGQNGAVLTFYELSKGDLVTNQEFYNIHPAILNKVIDGLVSKNRVVLMKDGNKTVGIKVL